MSRSDGGSQAISEFVVPRSMPTARSRKARAIELFSAARQHHRRLPRVFAIARTRDEALLFEALQRERERALLDVEELRELAPGEPGILSDEAQHHPLLRRDAHAVVHALRRRAERVIERP